MIGSGASGAVAAQELTSQELNVLMSNSSDRREGCENSAKA